MSDANFTKTVCNNISVTEIIKTIHSYTEKEGNNVGGHLYMVLSNKNIRNCDIEYCIKQAEINGDTEGANLGKSLLRLSKTQRLKVCHNWKN
jgi:hypothetical protein